VQGPEFTPQHYQKKKKDVMRALDWFKHSTFAGKMLRQNPHWEMNRHLNSKGQECKTGHDKGRALVGAGG
jgi:hypothetical protein